MNTTRTRVALAFALALGLGVGLSMCLLATPVSSLPTSSSTYSAALLATTYYVRPDGGSADQCTGQIDAPYPGSGAVQPCAWDHLFRALPPDGTPRISGGDTLIIASGSYTMGLGAPGADNCEPDYPWDCYIPSIPSGPDPAHPTRILGAGWDLGCADPPELWGTERPWFILNLTDVSNIEIACLEITDHSSCVESHSGGLECERDTYPYGDWAATGIYAEDSANVRLAHLNIHGLAAAGVHAGRLTDWTVEDVRIAGNGWVGWDGDIDGSDSNTGTLTFRRWTVEWNGCGETYPGGQPTGCWGQTAGGYGDGVGTGATGGDWIIEDSAFLHNTSDGLDLLYHSEGGDIALDRVHAEGNAGNQVKVTGQTAITNSVLVGNCAFFEGQSFTHHVDACRALGNTLEVVYTGGERVSIINSTFYGQGDGLVSGGPREGYSCDGTETLAARNNVFLGDTDYFDPGDITFLFYQEECSNLQLDSDYNVIHSAKNIECGVNGTYVNSGAHDLCQDPLLTGPITGTIYGMTPTLDSPAIDAGDNTVCPSVDHLGNARPADGDGDGDAVCDMGAYERQAETPASVQTRVFQYTDVYTGVRDTWISAHDWDTPPQYTVNYGQNERLALSRDGRDNPLLYFDLTTIPTNSLVLSATLALSNTTPGDCDGAGAFPRRVQLFRVLTDWDEGNQVQAAVTATVGAHGATGDYAFLYYSGGTDVPWRERGMAAGTDYAATPESYADVVNEGWYTWNVTSLVRAWVRGEQPNYGLVLRDATGYQVGNCDWRDFVSSQATADPSAHPKLTVLYKPNVPYADAGPDQENLTWDGGLITLDGSASHDRHGGDDTSLQYQWRIVQAACSSALTGTLPGATAVTSFTPDVTGEWEVELAVTNNLSETATDRVRLRLLSIPANHPRIYLTAEKLAVLQARAVPTNTRWTQLLAEADDPNGEMHAKALVSQVTGQTVYCTQAISAALDSLGGYDYATKAGNIALVYDWCYPQLDASQRITLVNYFNAWGDDQLANPGYTDVPGWGNYWPRYGYSFALVGLATFGDNVRAQEWLDQFRHTRYRDVDLPLLDHIAAAGGWPEGMIYDWIANWPRVKALDAWRTATGENLFQSTTWYRERLGYILLHRWPGQASQWGLVYHPYLSTGDTERNRGTMANYERIMALILIEQFPTDPLARQLQSYLATPPADNSDDFLYHEEFLWFNPDQPTTLPARLTHYAQGTGTIFMRSGWPDGAADTDTSATYLTFQTGDHFSYHQHYDQNSFTLFKYGDLALDSGVYSGDGRSDHDINYYARTIAHNTLIVYNPDEDFAAARPDAYANDGGQRTVYPASRAPETIEYFDQHATHYETGNVLRFEDTAGYTYALGDATAAYNNPTYNQATDTGLNDNVAKVSRFQREFVYLRPETSNSGDYLVLFDRVGVVSPTFSLSNTKLLFHTLYTPTINGTPTTVSPGETLYTGADLATAISGDGKLFIKMLLPPSRNVRRVGGRGVKAFWVFDANYDWHWDPGEAQPRPTNDFEDVPYGEWRLELEPTDAALEHNFLTVLHPTVSDTVAMPTTTLVAGTGLSGAHIADPTLNRVALFSSAPVHANDGSSPTGTLRYSYTPTTHTLNLLFDLTPGARYHVTPTLNGEPRTALLPPVMQVSSQGVLSFALEMGETPSTVTVTITLSPAGWQKIYLPLILKNWLAAQSQAPPYVAGCAVFPADNVWNTPVDTLSRDANSDAYVATIGIDEYVHADFGSGSWEGSPIGIPYVDVSSIQPMVPAAFTYADESDPDPYPIPPDAPIEGGTDTMTRFCPLPHRARPGSVDHQLWLRAGLRRGKRNKA